MRIRFRIQLINFDADPDADPGYQNDADPCGGMEGEGGWGGKEVDIQSA